MRSDRTLLQKLREDGALLRTSQDVRVLRVLIGSSMLSKVADWQLGIVMPLAIFAETDSAAMSLISFALRGVAYIISPILGSLIDRFDKRTIYAAAQIQQAFCLTLLAAMLSSPVSVSLLLLLSGIGGVVSTITGQFVLIPTLISSKVREMAIAKLSSAIGISKVIGLLLGGLTFSALGPIFASLCIAGLYACAGFVARMLPRSPADHEETTMRRDLAIGFQWLRKREIIWLVVTMSIVNLAVGQLEPALITELASKDIDPRYISCVLAAGLFTGAVASRYAPQILASGGTERRILIFQVAALAGLGFVAVPVVLVKMFGYMIVCFAFGATNVASITYRQQTIPVAVAGRVNSTIRMFIAGAVPLSGFLYAWSSRFTGYLHWLPVLAISAVAVGIWCLYTFHFERTTERDSAEAS